MIRSYCTKYCEYLQGGSSNVVNQSIFLSRGESPVSFGLAISICRARRQVNKASEDLGNIRTSLRFAPKATAAPYEVRMATYSHPLPPAVLGAPRFSLMPQQCRFYLVSLPTFPLLTEQMADSALAIRDAHSGYVRYLVCTQ